MFANPSTALPVSHKLEHVRDNFRDVMRNKFLEELEARAAADREFCERQFRHPREAGIK